MNRIIESSILSWARIPGKTDQYYYLVKASHSNSKYFVLMESTYGQADAKVFDEKELIKLVEEQTFCKIKIKKNGIIEIRQTIEMNNKE